MPYFYKNKDRRKTSLF